MPLIVQSVRARAKIFLFASPGGGNRPQNQAGDALGTQSDPIYADRRRPLASSLAIISPYFI